MCLFIARISIVRNSFYIGWLILAAWLTACSAHTAEEYYRQGRRLREADEPVAAMEAFIAATRVHSREYIFKARAFSNMATMCRIGEQHETAYSLYEKSLEQFVLANDTLAQAYALNNMAWEQAVMANKNASMSLVDSALSICSDTAVQRKVLESRAAACLYAAEYDSALLYAKKSPEKSVYLDILCAQAYTFLQNNDSAVLYAGRVIEQTDNPRYLDDVYYILSHCDTVAQVADVRTLADKRTDIQRTMERGRTDWIFAMALAKEALNPQKQPMKVLALMLGAALIVALIVLVWWLWRRKIQIDSLEQQGRALRKSTNLREELHWNNYAEFTAVCNMRLGGIVEKLEQRGLTEREIRLSVLVLIGLTYAQMADVLIRAENGIGKDKYLVAKRLGVSVKELQGTLWNIANVKTHA